MNIINFAKTSPVTLALLIAIVGYFALQVAQGVSPDNPTTIDLLSYGANTLPYTMNHQAWRLVSSGFVHVGIIHLLLNGFALYYFGSAIEVLLGKWRYLWLFLLAVIGGNLLTLHHAWYLWQNSQNPFVVNAGASGGIMGLGACLLMMSFGKKYKNLLDTKSLFIVMIINLASGFMIANINNAGHIGGACVGVVMGLAVAFLPKPAFWVLLAVLVGGFFGAWYYLLLAVTPHL